MSKVTQEDKDTLIGFDDLALYRIHSSLNRWDWPLIFEDEELDIDYNKGRRRALLMYVESLVGGAEKMNRLHNPHMSDEEHHAFYNTPLPDDAVKLLKKLHRRMQWNYFKKKVKKFFLG